MSDVERTSGGAHLDGFYAMTPGFFSLFSEDNEWPAVLLEVNIVQYRGRGRTSSVV